MRHDSAAADVPSMRALLTRPVHAIADDPLTLLIARSRRTVQQSRWLVARASALRLRSARLCPTPLRGASDGAESLAATGAAASNTSARPRPFDVPSRRSVLVLAHDPVIRAFIADGIGSVHDVIEADDVASALKVVAGATRVDVVVAGCFMFLEPSALDACVRLARELYDEHPWIPVVVVGDTPPPALKAALLLTAARAFVPRDFAPADLASTVARVGRPPGAAVPSGERVAAIKRTFGVLANAVTDVPALSALAAMASMSRSHFSRTFHAVAGISLRDYVRDLRLKRAEELMRVSGLSLTAIAVAAGFYDLPHFNKAFRHRFGMSPTQFRLASARFGSRSAT